MLLIPNQVENGEDEKGSKVLNIEHIVPSDLFAEVFEGKFVIGWEVEFEGSLVVGKDDFFIVGFVGELLLVVGDFG